MTLPNVGDVYETNLPGKPLLWCISVHAALNWLGQTYEFLVVDGDANKSSRRFWTQGWDSERTGFGMSNAMTRFNFRRVV